jgi:hypothetical protein
MSVKNEIGMTYGRLRVLSRATSVGDKAAWFCKCSCGAVHVTTGDALRTGKVKSCGCYRMSGEAVRTHGQGSALRGVTPTYRSWQEMKARCTKPSHISYPNYGGRGISFISEWARFDRFFADMGTRPDNMSLDRRDNELGYSKENCKWSGRIEQNSNRRSVRLIEHLGKTQSLAAWCRELNVPYPRTYSRFVIKQEPFEAAIMPKRKPGIQSK